MDRHTEINTGYRRRQKLRPTDRQIDRHTEINTGYTRRHKLKTDGQTPRTLTDIETHRLTHTQ